ncbi:MAG: VanZ family protein, partial [Nitrospinae bacterium]|nr:VanZ family protein [Nitrospinota bacterium]
MDPLKFRFLWTLIGYSLVVLVVVLSLYPTPPSLKYSWMDKVLHVLLYAVLMLWFAQLHPQSRYGWLAGGFVMLGILLEVLQSYTGYRSGDYWDVAANSFGTALGWGLAF